MSEAVLTTYQQLVLGSPGAGLDIRVFEPRMHIDAGRLAAAVDAVRLRHAVLRHVATVSEWLPGSGAGVFEHIVAHELSDAGGAAADTVARLSAELAGRAGRQFAVSLVDDAAQRIVVALDRAIADDATWQLTLAALERAYRGEPAQTRAASYLEWQSALGQPSAPTVDAQSAMPRLTPGAVRTPALLSPQQANALIGEVQRVFDATVIETAVVAWLRSLLANSRRLRERVDLVLQTNARAFPTPETIPADMAGPLEAFWRLSVPVAALHTLDVAYDVVRHQLREQTLADVLFAPAPSSDAPWLVVRMRRQHATGWLREIGEFADRCDAPAGIQTMRVTAGDDGILCEAVPGDSWLGPVHPDRASLAMRAQLAHILQTCAARRAESRSPQRVAAPGAAMQPVLATGVNEDTRARPF